MSKNIKDVQQFWESNPLWTGESQFESGTKDFFEEHRRVVAEDCFAGKIDNRIMPHKRNWERILDLGCGPGLWTVEISQNGCKGKITAADLTINALALAKERCRLYGVEVFCSQQNAEKLAFRSAVFSHVNCQGVIHHLPNTNACIEEIARVLEDKGTASISVYNKNIILRAWPLIRWIGRILNKSGAVLSGRGRENIYNLNDVNEIVRYYDGKDNPIGKCYTCKEFIQMVEPCFNVKETFFHFFPVRTLPFKIPKSIHRVLDRCMGFLIYANLEKKQ